MPPDIAERAASIADFELQEKKKHRPATNTIELAKGWSLPWNSNKWPLSQIYNFLG